MLSHMRLKSYHGVECDGVCGIIYDMKTIWPRVNTLRCFCSLMVTIMALPRKDRAHMGLMDFERV